ncbi:MAG: glycosyltransferase family A protein [Puniceicoccales bacterium]
MTGISIIIPCYNHGQYLREAVDSVRAQTVPVDGIWIVDDGSDDSETLKVLEEIANLDGVRVLSQENSGPAVARNRAIREIDSPFVASLDADDRLLPEFVEKLLPRIEEDDTIGIAYGEARSFGVEGAVRAPQPYRFPEVLLDPCIYSTAIFRKCDWEAVGGFSAGMRSGWEDFEFWISVIETGREVFFLNEPVFEYRRHESSRDVDFSASQERVIEAFVSIYRKHQKIYSENIRLLFEAHIERLDWRNRFQGIVAPEFRFWQDGKSRVLLPERVSFEGESGTAEFSLEDVHFDDREFRFKPFDGPGEFQVVALKVFDEQGNLVRELTPGECPLIEHSFGRRVAENPSGWPILFFLVSGPQVGFRLAEGIGSVVGGRWEVAFRAKVGDAGGAEFLKHLDAFEQDYNESSAKLRSLELELAHVKQELAKEMSLRRKVQSSRGYQWTRPLARLFGGKNAKGDCNE